jgi:crotonobetainyl-CoA:carnitine CoA-transferase CaiB-like acyl-CoA transferase
VADVFAGLYGCIGVLAALRHKERTGLGQQVDIGMLDTHVAWLANQGMNYLATGVSPVRLGNNHPNIVPYQVFASADGYIVLSIGNDPTFAKFCNNFGAEALLSDERFITNAARVMNRQVVTETLAVIMKTKTTADWIEKLEALKIGCGPINNLEQVFADPQVKARNNLIKMEHASGTTMTLVANPVRLSETPADYRLPPPILGQHTNEVLESWLGLDAAELSALKAKNVI